jgi:transposase
METDLTITDPDARPTSTPRSALKSDRRTSIELITRGEPRRRWSTEQKQSIALESLAPGASPSAVARQHGIGTGLLYTWRKALLAAQPTLTRFARVEVASRRPVNQMMALPPTPPAEVPQAGSIEIVLPNNISIRVDAQVDPRALRRVLSVLTRP